MAEEGNVAGSRPAHCPRIHRQLEPERIIAVTPVEWRPSSSHDAGTPGHTHPLPAFTKVSPEASTAYTELILEHGLTGANVSSVDKAATRSSIMGGKAPGQFADALQSKVVKGKLITKAKAKALPAGSGIEGALHMHLQDTANPNAEERYVHRFVAGPDGTMVITCFADLLRLLDDPAVQAFEADTTFKRVIGDFNDRHRCARLHQRGLAAFFERLFDEMRAVKIDLTKKPLAFRRLTDGGNLIAMNSDLESAQVIGAAASFLKTNDPAKTGIPATITPQQFAPQIIKLCHAHAKRRVLFCGAMDDYLYILTFDEKIKTPEGLADFSAFIRRLGNKKIQDWWDHKDLSVWILACLVPALSPLSENDWRSTPHTTNTGEAQHHWTNSQTGIKLTLVDAISSVRVVDSQVVAEIRQSFESGIQTNPYNITKTLVGVSQLRERHLQNRPAQSKQTAHTSQSSPTIPTLRQDHQRQTRPTLPANIFDDQLHLEQGIPESDPFAGIDIAAYNLALAGVGVPTSPTPAWTNTTTLVPAPVSLNDIVMFDLLTNDNGYGGLPEELQAFGPDFTGENGPPPVAGGTDPQVLYLPPPRPSPSPSPSPPRAAPAPRAPGTNAGRKRDLVCADIAQDNILPSHVKRARVAPKRADATP
ncbi:hypothetical protein MKEN_00541000 [Mycena kentingensis (nom. inval.)]|nr:hypothetical protein MKEN_00541000 [Mycena kentingensis (nom. inval.)]